MTMKFGMVFLNSAPDFGNIKRSRNKFYLSSADVDKLDNLTKAVCSPLLKSGNGFSLFNVDVGTRAFVSDTKEVYIYLNDDKWHNLKKVNWKNPGRTIAGYVEIKILKSNEPYVFDDEENIKISVDILDYDEEVITNVLTNVYVTKNNYVEDGYYVLYLNLEQASKCVFGSSYDINYTLHVKDANNLNMSEEEIASLFSLQIEIRQFCDRVLNE